MLSGGRVVESGTAFDVFSSPTSDTARAFVSAALHNRPTSADLERLRIRHHGRIVTAAVDDNGGIGAVLSRAADHGVGFDILYGGISALQDKSFGSLTIELTGESEPVERVVSELREVTTIEEVPA